MEKFSLDRELFQAVLAVLENIKQVPRMYFGASSPPSVTFIEGMKVMYVKLGIFDLYQQEFRNVIESRGWRFSANHPFVEMREKGMDEESITKEVLEIEIEVWKKILG